MRYGWMVLLVLVLPAGAEAAGPAPASLRAAAAEPPATERVLPTPTVLIRFGLTATDVDEMVARLHACAQVRTVTAPSPGILEYVCSPYNVMPFGASLFRIYDLELLSDLARATEFAATIGSQPFVIAPRTFPTPMVAGVRPVLPPPAIPAEVVPTVRLPAAPAEPARPIVRRRAEAPPVVTTADEDEPPRPRVSAAGPSLREASERLSAAEARVASIRALLDSAREDLRQADATAAPLRDDVAARRRLADAGVIARNDVKAAEERLREAETAVAAAQAQVSEGERGLAEAEADRDAALAGVERAKAPPAPPPSSPPAPRPAAPPVPVSRPAAPEDRVPPRASTPDVPRVASPRGALAPLPPVAGFPAPTFSPMTPLLPTMPPAPRETLRLAPRGDAPLPDRWAPLPWPTGSEALSKQRWREVKAAWQCVVGRAPLAQGSVVQAGQTVLEVRQTTIARLQAEVAEEYIGFCRVGVPVEVEVPGCGLTYRGLISRVTPTHSPRPPGAAVEILLVEERTGGRMVYRDLEWMALANVGSGQSEPLAYRPPDGAGRLSTDVDRLFPLPSTLSTRALHPPADGQLSGAAGLVSSVRPSGFEENDPVARKKLARLQEWRRSFVEGMQTTVFPESGLTLTYPRDPEIARAVERMATRRVSHVPNMCARTLAEALGWGLGDAAMWATGLPGRGFVRRADGVARPGDLLVWPFTYGSGRSQHVGIAVGQGGAILLLSNQTGVLGTEPLTGGYLAFHRPAAQPRPEPQAPAEARSHG